MPQDQIMPVQKCKGTRDLSPKEMGRFRFIESVFRDSCLKWGYEEVRTPTLEYLHLFTAAGTLTPGRLSKVYSFLDWDGWSGQRVVLRPDGTIPIARYYIETAGSGEVARLFYVTSVFRFEETGRETRERWQCGAELIGPSSIAADVEMVVMALGILQRCGIGDVELRLSHAGLIRTLLARFGLSPEEQHKLFDRILDGDTAPLTGVNPQLAAALTPFLSLKGKSAGFLKNVSAVLGRDLPETVALFARLTEFAGLLDSLGIKYEIDVASGQGFEYYTGVIFQVWASGKMVAGGGRYDDLVPLLGGPDAPACGFALYADTLMELLKDNVEARQGRDRVVVYARAGTEHLQEAFELVRRFHEAGQAAEVCVPGETRTAARWRLEIQGGTPPFVLKDTTKRRRFALGTAEEVLAAVKAGK